MKIKDIRTLCYRCADDYITSGFELIKQNKKHKSKCDKCERLGFEYEIQFKK